MKQFYDTYFTTANIIRWFPLLKEKEFKDIVTDSFRYAVNNIKANIYAMTN